MRRALVVALSVGVVASCAAPAARAPRSGDARAWVRSNVTADDHAGSAACAPCHEAITRSWAAAAMKRMTRDDGPGVAKAPFDGRTFRFKDDAARLFSQGGARFVEVSSARFGTHTYRVTRVLGGRVREDFVGLEAGSDHEMLLPVSHVLATGELRYKGYSVMSKERPGLVAGPVWDRTCIFCHNTVPYLDTVLGALSKGEGYQGQHVDGLLPESRRRPFRVTDARGLDQALARELARVDAKGTPHELPKVISALRKGFEGRDLLEIGIGCEACHLGAKEHVADPSVSPSFAPRSTFLAADVAPGSSEAEVRACARCHQVLFSQYPHTWEGGSRALHPGGSSINSGEARDLLLGACASRIRCSTCHDVHGGKAARRDDGVCTGCHATLAAPDAQRRHTHHDPAREGARCVSCHLPEKNLGLEGRLVPYHRIGSPTDPAKAADRPHECVSCHRDWSAERLAAELGRTFGKAPSAEALRELYGDLSANVLRATLERGKPHEQIVAIQRLGEAKDRAAVRPLAAAMVHAIPIVRYAARTALERIVGAPCPVDLHAHAEKVAGETKAWLAKLGFAVELAARPVDAPPDEGER